MQKTKLRELILDEKNKLSDLEIKEKSFVLENRLKKFLDLYFENLLKENVKEINILAYYPLRREPDFKGLYRKLLRKTNFNIKINLAFPRVYENNMEFYIIKSLDDFEQGKFKVFEPKKFCEIINKNLNNIVIVPCLAIHKDLFRLGYGAGYYDRYFSEICFRNRCFLIGSTFDEYKNLDFFYEKFDIKMNYII